MNDTFETVTSDMVVKIVKCENDIKGVIDLIMKELSDPESFVLLENSGAVAIRNTIELLLDSIECLKSISENAVNAEERLSYLETRVLKLECQTESKSKKE